MGWAKERPPAIPVSIMDRLWTSRPSQTSIWSPRTASSRGRLRISVPLLFGHVAMGRIAARFTETSTELRREIIAEDRYVDLVEEGYDIAIRVNPDPDDPLVGRRFLHDQLLFVVPASLPLR
jgi:DNA-binding transcriptional LysR family regulator